MLISNTKVGTGLRTTPFSEPRKGDIPDEPDQTLSSNVLLGLQFVDDELL